MTTITHISFNAQQIQVALNNQRTLTVPLFFYQKLAQSTPEQLNAYRLLNNNRWIRWDELDENLSIESLLLISGDRA